MAVLYRKYRPQTFAQVVGQKHIIRTLENQVALGRAEGPERSRGVAHAYLFTGSRGVGKTSIARILAKAVNCVSENRKNQKVGEPAFASNFAKATSDFQKATADESEVGNGDACGECTVCKQIEQGNFIDLVEIDAASNTGVDNIRELIEHVKFSPGVGKYKVFIIDEVHMLSKGAFNALLKTLEEPPKHAIFILATTEINKVPATIISRTQRFDFKALPPLEILGQLQKICGLEKISLSPEVLDLVAQNADGSLRDALSLLDKVITLGPDASVADCQQLLGITDIAVCEQLLGLMASGELKSLPEFFDVLSAKGLDFAILNRDFLEYLRKVLIYKITQGKEVFSLSEEHLKKLKDVSDVLSPQDLMFIIRLFLRSYKDLDTSPSPQIPLLLAALEGGFRKSEKSAFAKATADKSENQKVGESEPVKVVAAVKENPADKVVKVFEPEKVVQPTIIMENSSSEAENLPTPKLEKVNSFDEPTMTLEQVEGHWPKIIVKIKLVNGPLANLLKSCSLVEVVGSKVYVSVKFLFNKQHLENPKNTQLIVEAFEQITGKKMSVSARVLAREQPQVPVSAALTDALQIFGGELVE